MSAGPFVRVPLIAWVAWSAFAMAVPSACNAPVVSPPFQTAFKCGELDMPCGDGCIPYADNNTCCAAIGSGSSSYCVSGGCYKNENARCGDSAFCCTPLGQIGSKDCPQGQHHCGLGCQPIDQPCCDEAKGIRCNKETIAVTSCEGVPADANLCAYCAAEGICKSCPAGSCCHGDPCKTSTCVGGDACPGSTAGGGTGGSGTGGSGGCGLPSQCSSDADCSAFGGRNCNPGDGARCGSDGLCHCCFAECSSGSGQCSCLGCEANCTGDKTCVGSTCVFAIGGNPCQ